MAVYWAKSGFGLMTVLNVAKHLMLIILSCWQEWHGGIGTTQNSSHQKTEEGMSLLRMRLKLEAGACGLRLVL